jgi:hypothetical protein
MNRAHVLKSLQDNQKWLEAHKRVEGRSDNDWRTQDIMIGCAEILGQCHQSLSGWIDEKPYRRPVLGRLQKSWATRDGKRTLRDLIRWTEAAVEAATWIDEFSTGALPMDKEPRRLSEAHNLALQIGRKRAVEKWPKPAQRCHAGSNTPAISNPKTGS